MSLITGNKKTLRDVIKKEMLELKSINHINYDTTIESQSTIQIPNRLNLVTNSNGSDVSNVLSNKYVIKSAGNHLYLCGLSLFKWGDKQRSRLYNPILILVINLLVVFRSIISFFVPEMHEHYHVYLGNFMYVLKAQNHLNPAVMGFASSAILQQLIHIYDYRKNKTPSYLKIFCTY